MSHTPKSIAIAVVEWQGQFLVGQRPSGQTLAGCYEFPGGHVESQESPSHAALRECLEETGLTVNVVGAYPEVDYAYEHGEVRLYFFACRPANPEQPPYSPFRWVSRGELVQLPFPAANRAILAQLVHRDDR